MVHCYTYRGKGWKLCIINYVQIKLILEELDEKVWWEETSEYVWVMWKVEKNKE